MAEKACECHCCGHPVDSHDGYGCTEPWSEGKCRCFYSRRDLLVAYQDDCGHRWGQI